MEGFAKARYGLLGKASHWFPGENADCLDKAIHENTIMNRNEEMQIESLKGMIHALDNETRLIQNEYVKEVCQTKNEETGR